MPIFEYLCPECNAQFEELISAADVKDCKDAYPCDCGAVAKRLLSAPTPVFKGSGGNTGIHDLDYPVLDKAVGRSAKTKWEKYEKRKEKRDEIRRKHGTSSLTVSGNKVMPTSPEKMELRRKALES